MDQERQARQWLFEQISWEARLDQLRTIDVLRRSASQLDGE
jgi:hypothetical protein